MKKVLLASAFMLVASNAFAGGFYISPKFGYTHEQSTAIKASGGGSEVRLGSDQDNTFHAGLAAGYDFSKTGLNLRVEGEYMYRFSADWDKQEGTSTMSTEAKIHNLNANVYYDFKNSSAFTPYIGGGIGLTFIDADFDANDIYSASHDKTRFAWNLQAGLDFALNSHNTIGLGYRYSELGKGEASFTAVSESTKYKTHEVTLSYRYTF